jgi:hypothetical protein
LSSPATAKVIEVDFVARRRRVPRPKPARHTRPAAALDALGGSVGFTVFWRPPQRRIPGEYLGGRWDWGMTLFVWTSDSAVGPVYDDLVQERGYVAQHLTRESFLAVLRRAGDVGGLLLDGELDGGGHVIRAEPDQLIQRSEALSVLAR